MKKTIVDRVVRDALPGYRNTFQRGDRKGKKQIQMIVTDPMQLLNCVPSVVLLMMSNYSQRSGEVL